MKSMHLFISSATARTVLAGRAARATATGFSYLGLRPRPLLTRLGLWALVGLSALAGCAQTAAPAQRQALASAPLPTPTQAPTRSPSQAPGQAQPAALPFAAWSEQFAARWVALSPEWATFTQYFSGAEQQRLDSQLAPVGPDGRQRWAELAREGLAELDRSYPASSLQGADRTGAAVLRWSLQRTLAGLPFEDHGFAFVQTWGLHLRYISLLAENHPLRRPTDIDSFMARLALVGHRLDEGIQRTRHAAARGLLPPRVLVERAQGQVRSFLAQPLASNDIIAGLSRRSALMPGLPPEQRQAAIEQATGLLQSQVLPAFERVLKLLDELHPQATAEVGLWRLPGGDKAYAQALSDSTTTALSAEAIHALGLREVARIEAQMEQVLHSMGRRTGTLEQRMQALRLELQPPPEPDPRQEMLRRYTAAVQDAQQRSQALFNLQPRAPIEVRRVPALTERTASAHYTTPTPDGSRPGIFWAPLPGPVFEVLRVRSLAVHEAVPGHHFQLAPARTPRAGPCTPSAWHWTTDGTKATCRHCWAGWTGSSSAPAAWWWTPGCTPCAGRVSKPSPTDCPRMRLSATSPRRARPPPTWWACCTSWRCVTKRNKPWVPGLR
jgi:uncharacterized protein (DUF885 family)